MTVALVGVHDPIAFFVGQWSTQRRMLDRTTGMTGSFRGITTFTPDDGGLEWDEKGTVTWPHFQGPASRSYRIIADGTTATVLFVDGRVLCRLDLGGGRARDEHGCLADTYRVDFAIIAPDSMKYSWDVTGAAKDLLLTTTLTRRA